MALCNLRSGTDHRIKSLCLSETPPSRVYKLKYDLRSVCNHLELSFKTQSSPTCKLVNFLTSNFYILKMRAVLICVVLALVVVAAMALPFPQNFDEAVKQAQSMSLIPKGAVVDRTFSGTQVAYFQLGRNDRVNGGDLASALDGVPPEIIANLEAQIANAQ